MSAFATSPCSVLGSVTAPSLTWLPLNSTGGASCWGSTTSPELPLGISCLATRTRCAPPEPPLSSWLSTKTKSRIPASSAAPAASMREPRRVESMSRGPPPPNGFLADDASTRPSPYSVSTATQLPNALGSQGVLPPPPLVPDSTYFTKWPTISPFPAESSPFGPTGQGLPFSNPVM